MSNPQPEVPDFIRELANSTEVEKPWANVPVVINPNGNSAYGRKALKDESAILASTPEGSRNHQLNTSAFSLGQLVAGGELPQIDVESGLLDAARQSGLPEKEIEKTLASGLKAGMLEPRTAPIEQAPQEEIQVQEIPEPPTEGNDPWKVYTLEDAYQDRPPAQYVLSGIFRLPSLNIVYGASGDLKSLLMGDCSASIAGGSGWLPPAPWKAGAQPFTTLQVPVMWLDFDNGPDLTHERFAALGRHYSLPGGAPFYYYSMPTPWLNARDKASIGALINRSKKLGIRLLFIDNLSTVSGDADENSVQMVKVMSHFRQLAVDANTAVVLIHHQRKSSGVTSRAGDKLRGHTSIEAALDLALLVEREPNSDIVTIRSTKTRGVDVYPFSAAFTYEHDNHGDLYKAAFYGLELEDTSSGAAIEREILDALKDTEMNKTKLTNTVKEQLPKVGVNRIRDRIDRLEAEKKITSTQGNRTERIYKLL